MSSREEDEKKKVRVERGWTERRSGGEGWQGEGDTKSLALERRKELRMLVN